MSSWRIHGHASKAVVQAALLAHDLIEDWDPELVIAGREVAEDRPDDWVLEGWYPRRPGRDERTAIAALFEGEAPTFEIEALADEDWLTLSQLGVDPIRAARFHVRTPDHAADTSAGIVDLVIPASQAFGTGQHRTTAGCLAMLDAMKRSGVVARDIADIGTGTGLLAFAALTLWPRALATASDIDAVCVGVVEDNAAANGFAIGSDRGELAMVVADGMDDSLLAARGPYDLLIANILAGPLIDLAPDFSAAVAPGGQVLLAGLLETQEPAVRAAYRRAGFRLRARSVNGDWSILWLTRRKVR